MADTTIIADEQVAANDTETGPEVEVDGELIEDELLVEEISIDGMCGVY
jgi:mycofactocin precursor